MAMRLLLAVSLALAASMAGAGVVSADTLNGDAGGQSVAPEERVTVGQFVEIEDGSTVTLVVEVSAVEFDGAAGFGQIGVGVICQDEGELLYDGPIVYESFGVESPGEEWETDHGSPPRAVVAEGTVWSAANAYARCAPAVVGSSWIGATVSWSSWAPPYTPYVPPEPTPTPTPGSTGPVIVELVQADRDRVDGITFAVAAVGGLIVLNLGALVVATVRR
jgi:hypothetical protein